MSQIFYEYLLLEQLGRKKASALYLAQLADSPDDQVVIKAFDAVNLRSDQEQEAFNQELSLFQKMDSPYILAPIDGGIEKNYPYVISSYLSAGSLHERLKESSAFFFSVENSIHILRCLGSALTYAHSLNILHANIKPENVLFYADDEPVLTDFRLNSLLIESLPLLSRPDVRNACYMAPEQFAGLVSKESDQYSLACLAYELLTGRPPFNATALSTWRTKHESEIPAPLTSFVPEIPPYVEEAVLRALSKDPVERYASIAEFLEVMTNTSEAVYEHNFLNTAQNPSDVISENMIIDSTVVSYEDLTSSTSIDLEENDSSPLEAPPLNKYTASGRSAAGGYADQYEGLGGEKFESHYKRTTPTTRHGYAVIDEDETLEDEDETLEDEDETLEDEDETLEDEDETLEDGYSELLETPIASEYAVAVDPLFSAVADDHAAFRHSIDVAIPDLQMYNATDNMLATLDAQSDVFFPSAVQELPMQFEGSAPTLTLFAEQSVPLSDSLVEGQTILPEEDVVRAATAPQKALKHRNRGRWIAIVIISLIMVVSLTWLLFGPQVYRSILHIFHVQVVPTTTSNVIHPLKNGISIGLTPHSGPHSGITLTPGNVQSSTVTTSDNNATVVVNAAGYSTIPATVTAQAQAAHPTATVQTHHRPVPDPGPPSPQPTVPVVKPVPTTPVPATDTPTPDPTVPSPTPTPTPFHP